MADMTELKTQVGGVLFGGDIDVSFVKAPVDRVKLGMTFEGKSIETEWIPVSAVDLERRKDWVTQLISRGYVDHTVMVGDVLEVVLRSRTAQQAMDAEVLAAGAALPDQVTQLWHITFQGVCTLASAIVKYDGQDMDPDKGKREAFLRTKSEHVLAVLLEEYRALAAELRTILKPKLLGALVKS